VIPVLVAGSGFAGSVITRELALSGLYEVTLIDRHDHIAGNAYDPVHSETGTQYHKNGLHIFHTNSAEVFNYLLASPNGCRTGTR
jgi:UDP-galactopyranose mutase